VEFDERRSEMCVRILVSDLSMGNRCDFICMYLGSEVVDFVNEKKAFC
jgi:hypothetical protein